MDSWYVNAIGEDGSHGCLINHSITKANLDPKEYKVNGKFKALLLVAKDKIEVGERQIQTCARLDEILVIR